MSKEREYKTDSTKGSSLINPVNYKGDVLVQVWIDSRVLATITSWMDGNGNYPRFMSQAVRRPLEVLAGFLVDNDEVRMIDDTAEARKMLERRFNVELNRGGRGKKNVVHNLVLSDRRGELGEQLNREMKIFDVNRPMALKEDSRVREGVEIYNKLFKDDKNNTSIDDRFLGLQGITTVKEKMTKDEMAEVIDRADKEEKKKLDELNNIDFDSLLDTVVKE